MTFLSLDLTTKLVDLETQDLVWASGGFWAKIRK